MKRSWPLLIVGTLLPWSGCSKERATPAIGETEPYRLELPAGAPQPTIPADNPLTLASVRLGKALFFDDRLSMGRGISCASCHHPGRAFSDTAALSTGVNGGTGFRNAPSLANVAYHPLLNRDGGAPTLEQQSLVPLSDTLEMGADINALVATLRSIEPYQNLSLAAYGRPFDLFVLTRALAAYERTLISCTSRFDRFLYAGDSTALSAQERAGWAIFIGARGNCSACHGGFDLSDHAFHNIGLAMDHGGDPGRQRITLDPADRGRFKTPTLRNIAITAPYMHDGSLATLEDVVDHFASGGLPDPNKDHLMAPLQLSEQEKQDLLAFMQSLTDERTLDRVP